VEATPMTLTDYWEIAKRRKWSFILPFLTFTLIFVFIALALPPVYKSSSTILIEAQEIPQNFVVATVTSFVEQRLQSINQRIMSTTRLFDIINRFDLYTDLRDKWTTEEIIEKIREDIKLELISTEVVDRRTGKFSAATIAFTVSYEGKDSPLKILQVANILASSFLEENLQVRERQTQDISKFLETEMTRQKNHLKELEVNIAAFKETHINELPELLPVNAQTLGTIERNIERLEDQLRTLKEREGYLQSQLASTPPELEANDQDEMRLEDLKLLLISFKSRFSDDHPDVIKTRAEIAELEKKVNPTGDGSQTVNKLPENPAYITLASHLSGTQADIQYTMGQIRDLEKEKSKYQIRIETTPRVEQEYTALMIELNNFRAKYDDLMKKLTEAKVAQALEKEQKGERFTLIDSARLPEKPYKPNRLALMLIGLVLGLGAGLGLACLREFSDQSIRTAESLTAATSFPVLAHIREIVTERDLRRRRIKQLVIISATISAVIAAVIVFHYLIMDLDIFWAKIMRRLAI
jgi:polysaccharide chain length determinant protein (PEP-CTERM system associated)